jgi:GNAT superfamily N-acetyltransferase
MNVRIAEAADWPSLERLFREMYRPGHPLHRRDFWDWQYGDPSVGRSIVAEDADGRFLGHVGAAFGGGCAWIINVYLDPSTRGMGLLRRMYDLARTYAPLTAASVNRAGLDMYRNMGWIRYCDLQRFVAVNPAIPESELLASREGVPLPFPAAEGEHFWRQPGITGVRLPTGSQAVWQAAQNGLRVIDLHDPERTAAEAFAAGVAWLDFVTSWNDPLCRTVDKLGWKPEDDAPIPWRLNPVVPGSRGHIAWLSEEHVQKDLIVRRTYSDHGRVGSLPPLTP